MSKNIDSTLQRYLAIGLGLGLAYFAINHFPTFKGTSSKGLSLEMTRQIIKEIKYQLYANCIAFVEGVDKKLKANYPEKDLQIFLRTQLAKTYENKEALILGKHSIQKNEFTNALDHYGRDNQIRSDKAQIFKVLEESIKGKIDLSVAAPAYKLYSDKDLLKLYRTMCEQIGVKVWEKLLDCYQNHPGFDPKDDQHFRTAMRELAIYEFKVKYLAERGFKSEWGCPNFIFLKLYESVKRDNEEIRIESAYVEKGYEEIVTKISADPHIYDRVHILRIMEDTITLHRERKAPQNKAQSAPIVHQPRPQVLPQQRQQPQIIKKPVVAPKGEEQFDMEKLMMEELMNRSQEISQQEKAEIKVQASVEVKPVDEKVEAAFSQDKEVEQAEQSLVEPVYFDKNQPAEKSHIEKAQQSHVQSVPQSAEPVQPSQIQAVEIKEDSVIEQRAEEIKAPQQIQQVQESEKIQHQQPVGQIVGQIVGQVVDQVEKLEQKIENRVQQVHAQPHVEAEPLQQVKPEQPQVAPEIPHLDQPQSDSHPQENIEN